MQAAVPIVPVLFRNVLDAFPKDVAIVRPATIETVVLLPIRPRHWTVEGPDVEIEATRNRYLETFREE